MKKIFAVLLALSFCLSLTACAQGGSAESDATSPTKTAPAPTEPSKPSHWTKDFYIDDFGDPTNDSYLRGTFQGSFSNSATYGSDLTVHLFLDTVMVSSNEYIKIRLLEYNSYPVSFIGCEAYNVIIKTKVDGTVVEDSADYLLSSSNDIVLKRNNRVFKAIINALNAGKNISFVITLDSKYSQDTYRFEANADGLENIYHQWAP